MPPRKQLVIKETKTKAIEEIDAAAEHLYDVREKRMKLTEEEVEAADQLALVMKKHKQNVYNDEGARLRVILKPGEPAKPKVKVERLPEEAKAEDGAGEKGEGL